MGYHLLKSILLLVGQGIERIFHEVETQEARSAEDTDGGSLEPEKS
jgi:hypothetical protein